MERSTLGLAVLVMSTLFSWITIVYYYVHPVNRNLSEKAADEDDYYLASIAYNDNGYDGEIEWYHLDRWVEHSSLQYDLIEGFLYVADFVVISWILHGCLESAGILPACLQRRQRRKIKDGRGVYSVTANFDDSPEGMMTDEDRESMEYGVSHDRYYDDGDDEYGEIHHKKDELEIAAEDYFNRGGKKNNKNRLPSNSDVLRLEMVEKRNTLVDMIDSVPKDSLGFEDLVKIVVKQ